MNYINHPYPFASHPGVPHGMHMEQPMAYDPALVHPTMMHPMDGYLYPHPHFDMVDYYHQPIMDYEEYAENLSRPRLTKEQVETLEAQFQAHPKPSSNVKRQLAAQTNLSLPRVANWFQNRRAKAKQQKRQEEYERMQKAKAEAEEATKGKSEPSESEIVEPNDEKKPQITSKDTTEPSSSSPQSANKKQTPTTSSSKHQHTPSESAREASLASLQRALNAAAAAQYVPDGQSAVTSLDGSVSPTTPMPKESDAMWGSVTSTGELVVPNHSQSLADFRSASDAGIGYDSMQYALQADVAIARRGSSDALADSLEGIGINGASHGLSQLGNRTDRAPAWKEAPKELDLAARRKRPRPAAIGTSRSCTMLSGSSTMSPTTRMPSYGTVKQSKSTQSLNSRYAGVRKASTQRSPLNLSTFAEAGVLSSAKTEMSTMLQPVTTSSLAPPTPLTPEELHHLLPNTPSTESYCLSAQPTSHLFPTTQPMQINIASPPATPLGMEMISPYQYQGVAPPMSAPAHYTTFPDYTCDGSLGGRSWEGTAMPSPEASFQNQCQMDMSMSYTQALEDHSDSASGSPFGATSEADLHTPGDAKATEFHLYEFPDQEEAHRFVAQQLPSHKPKAYTFTDNRTPTNFD